jgi:hypothetical protein
MLLLLPGEMIAALAGRGRLRGAPDVRILM